MGFIRDIRRVLAFAQQQGARPVVIGGAQAWRVAGQLAQARVPVIVDPLVDLPDTFDQLGATLENAARLHGAGVRIAFTNLGDGTHNARKVRQAAGIAVAHGLPWDAALAALTANPAEIFGIGAEYGRIAPGYVADLVLWSGDPLEVTSVAEQVWIDGRAQPMRSRQSELRDRYRPGAR
jgi:imidazolonepropionase-like amidohydrolase